MRSILYFVWHCLINKTTDFSFIFVQNIRASMENGDIPEDANERMNIFVIMCLNFDFALLLYIPMKMIIIIIFFGIYRLPRSSVWFCWKIWFMSRKLKSTILCHCHCPQRTWSWYSPLLSYDFMFISKNNDQLLIITWFRLFLN
jgi:hypothetical protein